MACRKSNSICSSAPVLSLSRLTLERSISISPSPLSPKRSLQASSLVRSVPAKGGQRKPVSSPSGRQMCLCSPSNHPGAFRCRLHRNCPSLSSSSSSTTNYQLHMRRSAMQNSLVRIGSVEGGEWVKKALTALIRPSSHQVRRRRSFQPQPSRLRLAT